MSPPKAWFRHELMPMGLWQPVVYLHNKPTKMAGHDRVATEFVELKPEDFDEFGEPISFGILSKRYPNYLLPKEDDL